MGHGARGGYALAIHEQVIEVATKKIDKSSPAPVDIETKETKVESSRLTYAKPEQMGIVKGYSKRNDWWGISCPRNKDNAMSGLFQRRATIVPKLAVVE